MEKLPRHAYTSEFRHQAVELVTREGLGIAEASRRLSISPKTLTNWVRRAKGWGLPDGVAPARGHGRGGRAVAFAAGERRVADRARHPKSWLYVAAIKDLFAGEIVGRSFGARMTTDLVMRAFEQAVSAHRPAEGLIHHSDRGSQYCSHEYQALLGGQRDESLDEPQR